MPNNMIAVACVYNDGKPELLYAGECVPKEELDESVVARGPAELPAAMRADLEEQEVGGYGVWGSFAWSKCPATTIASTAECGYGKSFSKTVNTGTYYGLCSSLTRWGLVQDTGSTIGVTLSGSVCGDATWATFEASATINMWVCGVHLDITKSVKKKFGKTEIVIFNEDLGLMTGWSDKLILKAKISRGTAYIQAQFRLYPYAYIWTCAQMWTDWISVYSMSELEAEEKLAALPAPEYVEAESAQLTENSLASIPGQNYLIYGLAFVGVTSLIYAIASQCNQKSYTKIFPAEV